LQQGFVPSVEPRTNEVAVTRKKVHQCVKNIFTLELGCAASFFRCAIEPFARLLRLGCMTPTRGSFDPPFPATPFPAANPDQAVGKPGDPRVRPTG
jgi:hypothetical protein